MPEHVAMLLAPVTTPTAPTTPTADPVAILESAKTIAVVGMSSNPSKPSNFAPMELARRGWNVIPVNPNTTEIGGMKAYPTLADVPVPIDIVDVFRPSAEAGEIAAQAARAGAKALWLQVGITSTEARDTAAAAGMSFVENVCAGGTAAHLNLYPNA